MKYTFDIRRFALLALAAALVCSCTQTGKKDDELETTSIDVNTTNVRDVRPRCRIENGSTLTPTALCTAVLQTPTGDRAIRTVASDITLDWSQYEHLSGQVPQSAGCTTSAERIHHRCEFRLQSPDTTLGRVVLTPRSERVASLPPREATIQLPFFATSIGYNPLARGAVTMPADTARANGARAALSGEDASKDSLALAAIPVDARQLQIDQMHGRSSALCELDPGSGPLLFFSSTRAIFQLRPSVSGGFTAAHFLGGRYGHVNVEGPISSPFDVGVEGGAVLVCDPVRKRLHALYRDSVHDTLWLGTFDTTGRGEQWPLRASNVSASRLAAAALAPDGKIYLLFQSFWSDAISAEPKPGLSVARTIVELDLNKRATRVVSRFDGLAANDPEVVFCRARVLANSVECNPDYAWGGLAVSPALDLYVADTWKHQILRLRHGETKWTVVAGSGQRGMSGDVSSPQPIGALATGAKLNYPTGLAFSSDGYLYIADTLNQVVRRLRPDGRIETVLGTDGTASTPSLSATNVSPVSLAAGAMTSLAMGKGGKLWAAGRTLNTRAGSIDILWLAGLQPAALPANGIAEIVIDARFRGLDATMSAQQPPGVPRPVFEALPSVLYQGDDVYLVHHNPGLLLRLERTAAGAQLQVVAGNLDPRKNAAPPFWPPTGDPTRPLSDEAVWSTLDSTRAATTLTDGAIVIATKRELRHFAGGTMVRIGPSNYFKSITAVTADDSGALYVADDGYHQIFTLPRPGTGGWGIDPVSLAGNNALGDSVDVEGQMTGNLPRLSGMTWFKGALYFAVSEDRRDARVYRLVAPKTGGEPAKLQHIAGSAEGSVSRQVRAPALSIKLHGTLSLSVDGDSLLMADLAGGAVYRLTPDASGAFWAQTLHHAGANNGICMTGTVPISQLADGGAGSLAAALTNLCPGMPSAVAGRDRCNTADPHRELVIANLFDQFSTVTLVRAPCDRP